MSETDEGPSESPVPFRTPLINALLGSDVTDDDDEDDEIILSTENSEIFSSEYEEPRSSSSSSQTEIATGTLNSAIRCDRYEVVKLLLRTGANVNKPDDHFGITPLMQACRCNKPSILQLLLENGAQVNVRQNNHGTTALYWAVKKGNIENVKLLLDHGAQVRLPRTVHNRNMNLLHVAVKSGKVDILNLLCQHGGDVNEHHDAFGETPLFHAVRANDFEMVERLLVLGSSVNTFSYDLATPLHLAAGNVHRNIDILQLLLDNGALVNSKDHRGYIPFVMCLNTCSFLHKPATLSICECLVRHGSLVNDEHSHQALQWQASHSACFSLLKLCVAAGLDLYKGNWASLISRNTTTSTGETEQDESEQDENRMSVAERQEFEMFILYNLRNPHILSDCCRVAVRTYLTGIYQGASIYYHIQKLPLPESIILFLLLEE